jgi:hypothetical protein
MELGVHVEITVIIRSNARSIIGGIEIFSLRHRPDVELIEPEKIGEE